MGQVAVAGAGTPLAALPDCSEPPDPAIAAPQGFARRPYRQAALARADATPGSSSGGSTRSDATAADGRVEASTEPLSPARGAVTTAVLEHANGLAIVSVLSEDAVLLVLLYPVTLAFWLLRFGLFSTGESPGCWPSLATAT